MYIIAVGMCIFNKRFNSVYTSYHSNLGIVRTYTPLYLEYLDKSVRERYYYFSFILFSFRFLIINMFIKLYEIKKKKKRREQKLSYYIRLGL